MNRRQFMKQGSSALGAGAAALHTQQAWAQLRDFPLGLQLYSVREFLPKDYPGTLKQIAALGYTEVESAGYNGHSAEEVKAAITAAGLHLVSAHHSANDLNKDFDNLLAFNKAVGVKYLICSFPAIKDPSRLQAADHKNLIASFTMEDFRWNADRFNEWGKKAKAAGLQFGYHNHTMEFAPKDGLVPFEEMIRLTDPSLVTFEMDCGWVVVGGGDPVKYLHNYPQRISMLHVKDFRPFTKGEQPVPTELGRGIMANKLPAILAAAKSADVHHCFVEQEGYDMPWVESLRTDAAYM